MTSYLLDFGSGDLLEFAMDFRDNWLAHFKAIVKAEIVAADGNARQGYRAVAAKIEKGEETVYQHFHQKGKIYPTIEMMIAIEKKYGNGRAPGWTSLPLDPDAIGFAPWPFTLFNRAEYMLISPDIQRRIESELAGEVQRAKLAQQVRGNGTDG